jgi:hypothetical protein
MAQTAQRLVGFAKESSVTMNMAFVCMVVRPDTKDFTATKVSVTCDIHYRILCVYVYVEQVLYRQLL